MWPADRVETLTRLWADGLSANLIAAKMGITRNAIMELARGAGIVVQELALTRHDVYIADECFLTGTAAEVIPVVKCDGRLIGNGKPGAITRRLREMFQQLTRA